MSPTLIVTGMHRSGTSLTASLIQALGVNLGENFFPSDPFNVKGYFEDLDFLEFQRSVLQACCPTGDPGWPDWGWTESEQLNRAQFQQYRTAAQELIDGRSHTAAWGWKDPRTSLMLDFWHELLPDVRYLLVYRLPWDVADSILRIHSPVFSQRPDYPLRIWSFYNRNLLNFYQKYPDKCLLFNINKIFDAPERFIDLLRSKFNLEFSHLDNLDHFTEIYDQRLFHQLAWHHPTVQLLQKLAPDYFSLVAELDAVADIPSDFSFAELENTNIPESLLFSLHYQNLFSRRQVEVLSEQISEKENQFHLKIHELKQQLSDCQSSKPRSIQKHLSNLTALFHKSNQSEKR